MIDDGLIEDSERMVEVAVDLKLWQVAKTGFDDAPLAALKARGIPTCNCPGSTSGVALGECAMMFIMMLARRYNECVRTISSTRRPGGNRWGEN